MTLRELLQSVDAEAYASIPLYEKLLKVKPEYGFSESEETDFWNDMTNLQKAKIIR